MRPLVFAWVMTLPLAKQFARQVACAQAISKAICLCTRKITGNLLVHRQSRRQLARAQAKWQGKAQGNQYAENLCHMHTPFVFLAKGMGDGVHGHISLASFLERTWMVVAMTTDSPVKGFPSLGGWRHPASSRQLGVAPLHCPSKSWTARVRACGLPALGPREPRTILNSMRKSHASPTTRSTKAGFLGPFTMEDLDRTLPGRIPARRFGVRQGQKVRAIDEFSAFLHNAMVSTRAAST